MITKLDWKKLDAIVFDFDGVLTDNRVYVGQNGDEWVCCNRGDGLGFDVLRQTSLKLFILSTETNPVVTSRGKKIGIVVYQGEKNKEKTLNSLAEKKQFDLNKTLFVGNDLNDYKAMQASGFSACPSDSHPGILEIATFRLSSRGGEGVVREIVEDILKIDPLDFIA